MPHSIFDLVDSLYDFEGAVGTFRVSFLQNVRKYFVYDIWVSTIDSEFQSPLLLINLEQERNFLNDGLLISNQKLWNIFSIILMRNLGQFCEIDIHLDILWILILM